MPLNFRHRDRTGAVLDPARLGGHSIFTFAVGLALGLAATGCEDAPRAAQKPTWADVEPILRGNCTSCHGATASVTGAAQGGMAYRLDFYDMTASACGAAATVLGGQPLAHSWAALIGSDVTSPGSGWRPRMPPAPASSLPDWERDTLVRWAAEADPAKGEARRDNRRPDIQLVAATAVADKRLDFTAIISDADGEAVVGVIKVGDVSLPTDHAGAFSTGLDTSTWAAGVYPISAVLCDGWDDVTYQLGNLQVAHASASPR
jgi:hypothetical protein